MSRIYYRGAKAAIVCFGKWEGSTAPGVSVVMFY